MEDGLKANLFKIDELNNIPVISDIIYKRKNDLRKKNKNLALRQIIREIINEMVKDIIINTKKNLKHLKPKNINDIYNADINLVRFSKKMLVFDTEIKNFLTIKMYCNKKVLKKTNEGRKIIKTLFNKITKNPKKFINSEILNRDSKERAICDFVAGMTDRYAINLYKSIK